MVQQPGGVLLEDGGGEGLQDIRLGQAEQAAGQRREQPDAVRADEGQQPAVASRCFELKVALFVLNCSINPLVG